MRGALTRGIVALGLAPLLVAVIVAAVASGESPGTATVEEGDEEPTPARDKDDGRFRSPRRLKELTDEQRMMIERLEALGYVQGSVEASQYEGITRHDRRKTRRGWNLVTSGHEQVAQLMDMDGTVFHEWRAEFHEVFPGDRAGPHSTGTKYFRRATLLDDGELLVIYEGLGLVKLDVDSNVLWARRNLAHHALQVLDNGEIVVLTREAHLVPRVNPELPILEDFVSWLDADGEPLREPVSVLECFENSEEYKPIWDASKKRSGDIFHTNGLEVLDGRAGHPAFSEGRILLSFSRLHAVGVADLDQRTMVWAAQDDFKRQHDPRILDDGTLMLFDNRGVGFDDGKGLLESSRVLVYDPATMQLVWSYAGDAEDPFYTRTCGINQRLPNGNTLITESDNGRAIEVTPDGTIVWEYYNPHYVGRFVASLLEVERIDPRRTASWLKYPMPAWSVGPVPPIIWIPTVGIAVVAVVVVVVVRRRKR